MREVFFNKLGSGVIDSLKHRRPREFPLLIHEPISKTSIDFRRCYEYFLAMDFVTNVLSMRFKYHC